MYVKPHLRAAKRPKRKKRHDRRIVVELVSAADVARLEARDDAILAELKQIRAEYDKRLDVSHRDYYEVMEALARLRNKK